MRLPRFFAKKRGDRRTGAEVWGSVGEAVFHGWPWSWPDWRSAACWSPAWRCRSGGSTTTSSRLAEGSSAGARPSPRATARAGDSSLAALCDFATRPPRRAPSPGPSTGPQSSDRTGRGRTASRTCRSAPNCPAGTIPRHPQDVVLERGYNWWMWALTLLLPGALLAFGGAGLARALAGWGKSEERQAAGGGLGGRPDRRSGGGDSPSGRALLRRSRQLTGHDPAASGCRLESPENWTLLGFGLFAVLWNAVLVVLAINAGLDLLGGRIDWLLLAILVPFAAVGIAGIVGLHAGAGAGHGRRHRPNSRFRTIRCGPAAATTCCWARAGSGTFRETRDGP